MLLSEQLDLRRTLQTISAGRLELAKRSPLKIPVGQETREGWKGCLEFYVFWCRACEAFSKDYAHGLPEMEYVTCQHCGRNIRWNEREPHPERRTVLVMRREAAEALFAPEGNNNATGIEPCEAMPAPVMNPWAMGYGLVGGAMLWVGILATLFGVGKLIGFW
ncbi:MAG: hypothetical protein Q8R35_00735 [bacterium]|nr:hypothetical protein [bacterium]